MFIFVCFYCMHCKLFYQIWWLGSNRKLLILYFMMMRSLGILTLNHQEKLLPGNKVHNLIPLCYHHVFFIGNQFLPLHVAWEFLLLLFYFTSKTPYHERNTLFITVMRLPFWLIPHKHSYMSIICYFSIVVQ